jgi:hypothetical protein
MKTRHCLVSNSSSSSFIINKEHLTRGQIDKINNHIEWAPRYGIENGCSQRNGWDIDDLGEVLKLSTSMNNFSMLGFLGKIGVDTDKIEWH